MFAFQRTSNPEDDMNNIVIIHAWTNVVLWSGCNCMRHDYAKMWHNTVGNHINRCVSFCPFGVCKLRRAPDRANTATASESSLRLLMVFQRSKARKPCLLFLHELKKKT
jgi:hypothetical protein